MAQIEKVLRGTYQLSLNFLFSILLLSKLENILIFIIAGLSRGFLEDSLHTLHSFHVVQDFGLNARLSNKLPLHRLRPCFVINYDLLKLFNDYFNFAFVKSNFSHFLRRSSTLFKDPTW